MRAIRPVSAAAGLRTPGAGLPPMRMHRRYRRSHRWPNRGRSDIPPSPPPSGLLLHPDRLGRSGVERHLIGVLDLLLQPDRARLARRPRRPPWPAAWPCPRCPTAWASATARPSLAVAVSSSPCLRASSPSWMALGEFGLAGVVGDRWLILVDSASSSVQIARTRPWPHRTSDARRTRLTRAASISCPTAAGGDLDADVVVAALPGPHAPVG